MGRDQEPVGLAVPGPDNARILSAPQKIEDRKSNAEQDGVPFRKVWFYERHPILLPDQGGQVVFGRPSGPAPASVGARRHTL